MIQLTEICYDLDGNPYERIINVPDSILVKDAISNRIGGGKSIVIVPGVGTCEVKETRNEVARKVLEWRLAMEGYRIFTKRASFDGDYDVANLYYDELKRLSGLEEPKNAHP